jgi:hypothetical protein
MRLNLLRKHKTADLGLVGAIMAGMEAEQEWDGLVSEWDKFLSISQFDQTAEEVGEAARRLGLKMMAAYDSAKKPVG